MLRDCDINEISDGKKYTLTDMVKVTCDDCKGCSACCSGMGSSLVLDPLDVHRISVRLGKKFEELLEREIELNIVDGVILPNIKMTPACTFLNEEGRCSIHTDRPGICRIFPLGRYYENDDFTYILQVNECPASQKAKVKVSKWIDTPQLKENQDFIRDWHYFLRDIHDKLAKSQDEQLMKQVTMRILQFFYMEPYTQERDFYEQFQERLSHAKKMYLG